MKSYPNNRSAAPSIAAATLGAVGRWLLLLGLVFTLLGCGGGNRVNVVLITMDTTRADHLGAYGSESAQTPHIDSLAEQGFVFKKHLTPVPITLPSHTSLFTGHYPPTHSVRDNGTFIVPHGERTLAEALKKRGFDTSAFVAAFPLHSKFGLDQGFGVYDDAFTDRYYDVDGFRIRPKIGVFFDERPAADVVDAAIEYHQRRKRKPFFTFLHFFDPHQPLNPPPPYDVTFRDHPYDGEIAYVDEQIGRFFDFLKQRGEWENTLVILTADHGEGLGEHGETTHAMLLHQATLHIPLIISGPAIAAGETERWTSSTQVLATVLDYLGIDFPMHDIPISASLLPLMRGEEPDRSEPFVSYFETLAPRTNQGWSQLVGYMKGDLRYSHGPRPHLFDLGKDPREYEDLYSARPESAGRLLAELTRFLQSHETVPVGESFEEIDEETMERLAALGYVSEGIHQLGQMKDMLDVSGLEDPGVRVGDISLFSEAKAAFGAGNWRLAFQMFKELVARTPTNVNARRNLALLHGLFGEWDACFAQLGEIVRITPDNEEIGRLTGELKIQSGRVEEGIQILKNLKTAHGSVEAIIWLGRAYGDLGLVAEAEQWLREGLSLSPDQRWLRLYLANLLAGESRFEEAEPVFLELLSDFPYFSLAWYNYGRMLLDRGDRGRARVVLERAALLNPDHAMTREVLASFSQRSG